MSGLWHYDRALIFALHPKGQGFGHANGRGGTTVSNSRDYLGDGADIGFVRVRKRKLKGGHPDWRLYRARHGMLASMAMSFDLVRAVRINGKPRHVFVLGLGSQKDHPNRGDRDLVHFWVRAISSMRRHKLTPEQRCWLAVELVRKGARLPTIKACRDSDWAIHPRSRRCKPSLPKLSPSRPLVTTKPTTLPAAPAISTALRASSTCSGGSSRTRRSVGTTPTVS